MSNYIWELRQKVGNYLLQVPAVSVVTRNADDKVLLVKHVEGYVWVLPGGTIEPLEAPADAAVREMWEETGLWVEPKHIIGVYGGSEFIVNYANGDKTSYLTVVFESQVIGGELRADGMETLEAKYFSQEEINSLTIPSWMQEVVPDVFAMGDQTIFRPPSRRPSAI